METEERYVITASKAQCCTVEPGKDEYYFVEADELLEEMIQLFEHYGGDNYNVAYFGSREEMVKSYGEDWPTLPQIKRWPVYEISSCADPELAYDENEVLAILEGDCGDWSLGYQSAATFDYAEKREILKAEGCLPPTVDEAWDGLW